jgi:hypothetical protein
LGEELSTEYAVVFQTLVAALELRHSAAVAGTLRRHHAQLKALQ